MFSKIPDAAEIDLLFELYDLFRGTIVEFLFQNRLWNITNIAKSHMDRVKHLALPLPKKISEIAEQHLRVAECTIRYQPGYESNLGSTQCDFFRY